MSQKPKSFPYKLTYSPQHSTYGRFKGGAFEHTVVMAKYIQRTFIPSGFHVHHRNQDKQDNRIENLILLPELAHHQIHQWLDENNVSEVQKMESMALNFMENLRSGKSIEESLPSYFLKYFKKKSA